MTFDELQSFQVSFDSPDTPMSSPPVFSGGDTVSGRVALLLSAATDLQALTLRAKGVAKVRFSERRPPPDSSSEEDLAQDGDNTREYSDEEEYVIQREVVLLRADNGRPTPLPAGRHEFPFSFQLPEETLATSFQGKHGSIRYWVKVKLQRPPGAPASVTEIKKEFTFIEHIDVNAPGLLEPQAITKGKNVSVWFRNVGHLDMTAGIPRKGYTPGEVVPVFAEFNNTTSRWASPKAFIMQTQTYVASGDGTRKTEVSVMAMVVGTKAAPGDTEAWLGHPMRIPMTMGPSILHCPIIKVEYLLRVFVDLGGTTKLWVDLPLVMGTIPLCSRRTVSPTGPLLMLPLHEESPPEYSSVVTEEEAQQYTSSNPPAYCEVDPYPQSLP